MDSKTDIKRRISGKRQRGRASIQQNEKRSRPREVISTEGLKKIETAQLANRIKTRSHPTTRPGGPATLLRYAIKRSTHRIATRELDIPKASSQIKIKKAHLNLRIGHIQKAAARSLVYDQASQV